MKFDPIYKRTTSGAIQEWQLEIREDGKAYRVISGQIDGRKVTSTWKECAGKNIGRSNETTDEEQTILECKSARQKKLDTGYCETVEEIDSVVFREPMRAQAYPKVKISRYDVADGLVWSQPKLDGFRCFAMNDRLWTRKGKEIPAAAHIEDEYKFLHDRVPGLILDGELYSHDLADRFQKLMSVAKKQKPAEADMEMSRKYLKHWVYDLPSHPGHFSERFLALCEIMDKYSSELEYYRLVDTKPITCMEDIDIFILGYIDSRYEGQIIRIDNAPYEYKRSKSLLKHKPFEDREFIIKGAEEGEGNWSGAIAKFIFETDEGKEFKAKPRGSYEQWAEAWQNPEEYLGEEATVRFMGYTDEGKPRHGIVTVIRDVAL